MGRDQDGTLEVGSVVIVVVGSVVFGLDLGDGVIGVRSELPWSEPSTGLVWVGAGKDGGGIVVGVGLPVLYRCMSSAIVVVGCL